MADEGPGTIRLAVRWVLYGHAIIQQSGNAHPVPDGGEEPGSAAGLGGEGLCGAKGFGQVEQFGGSPRDFVKLALPAGPELAELLSGWGGRSHDFPKTLTVPQIQRNRPSISKRN